MRYLIKFSYDGSNYYGFQRQKGLRTIQEELEVALTKINNGYPTTITTTGRTDKGVHALCQYGHADINVNINEKKLKRALNSNLPGDIHVIETKEVNEDFHARYNVKSKEYKYYMNLGEYNPLERNYVYQHNNKLDVVEMERAMKYFEGTHNFKSFTKTDEEKDDYVRTISQTNLIRDTKDINKITLVFVGTGFLRYMVRNMVGTLIAVGEGKLKSEDIIKILEKEDRREAMKTANPEGLYLKNVFY